MNAARAWLRDARVSVAEIRQENHGGDVSAKDIAWLCDVVEAALDFRDARLDILRADACRRLDRTLNGR